MDRFVFNENHFLSFSFSLSLCAHPSPSDRPSRPPVQKQLQEGQFGATVPGIIGTGLWLTWSESVGGSAQQAERLSLPFLPPWACSGRDPSPRQQQAALVFLRPLSLTGWVAGSLSPPCSLQPCLALSTSFLPLDRSPEAEGLSSTFHFASLSCSWCSEIRLVI